MNLFLLLATLSIASTSFAVGAAGSDITFIPAFELQSAASTKLEARDGLVNNILW